MERTLVFLLLGLLVTSNVANPTEGDEVKRYWSFDSPTTTTTTTINITTTISTSITTSKVTDRRADEGEKRVWGWDEQTTEAPLLGDSLLGAPWDNCDEKKYPNIEQGFRGYNVVLGTKLIVGIHDDGYKGMIFDHNKEKCSPVPFQNIAGNNKGSCSSTESYQFMENSNEFVKKTSTSTNSETHFQVGSETTISVNIPLEEVGVPGEVGVEKTIPPLYQTSSSNSKDIQNMVSGSDSKKVSIAKLSKKCSAYTYELQPDSPLPLHPGFVQAVQKLNKCWNKTATENKCAQGLLRNYGTHYIKSATFGALVMTTSVMDRGKADSASREFRKDCTRSSSGWSLFGVIGGGHSKEECNKLLETTAAVEESGFDATTTFSVGKTLDEFKDPHGDYKPEIIQREFAPLSEIFTESYMGDLSPPVDYDEIRPWLDGKISNYCLTFKAEHHCNHAVR